LADYEIGFHARIDEKPRDKFQTDAGNIALRRPPCKTPFSSPDWLTLGSHFAESEKQILQEICKTIWHSGTFGTFCTI
jgi:hypothetical protein